MDLSPEFLLLWRMLQSPRYSGIAAERLKFLCYSPRKCGSLSIKACEMCGSRESHESHCGPYVRHRGFGAWPVAAELLLMPYINQS